MCGGDVLMLEKVAQHTNAGAGGLGMLPEL